MVSTRHHRTPSIPQRGLFIGVVLGLSIGGYSLLRYPSILTPLSTGVIYLALFVATLAGYVIIALRWLHPSTPDAICALRQGSRWGLVIGGLWLIEVIAGNLASPSQVWALPAYFCAALLAYLLPALAGFLSARQTGRISTGALTGLWCGLVSGLLTFLQLMLIISLFLDVARHDPQNIRQFHQSQAPDLTTFIIGDALAGAIAHLLLIGPLLCTGVGAIGGVIGAALAQSTARAQRRT